jgi:hypothetical protein
MKPEMKKHGTKNRKNNETGKHGKTQKALCSIRCLPITLEK